MYHLCGVLAEKSCAFGRKRQTSFWKLGKERHVWARDRAVDFCTRSRASYYDILRYDTINIIFLNN
ncbi:hypothetical protein PUN28_003950 [Cardiocondyla obscurior]|uniref:Uncharacterized protein n=1 Tax=Cardiocondyla obscurior TaxID=286306 RepID=A0AAW2GPE6_9HYME